MNGWPDHLIWLRGIDGPILVVAPNEEQALETALIVASLHIPRSQKTDGSTDR